MIYINSTLPVQKSLKRDGTVSPLHNWGFTPGSNDVSLAHQINRYEITARAKLGGLDLRVLARALWALIRGQRRLYAVTQPDIWQAFPLLRRLFPSIKIVTWAWTDWEAKRHCHRLLACDHVLCLTEGAKQALDSLGMTSRASLAIWGCPAQAYAPATPPKEDFDAVLLGITGRDMAVVLPVISTGEFTVLTTARALASMCPNRPAPDGLAVEEADTHEAVVCAFHRSRVAWIPIKQNDPYPTGYTNLVEALLCGTAVVIADCSIIPSRVLSLPGVFPYRTGSPEAMAEKTREALRFMQCASARKEIATAAAALLNGEALAQTIRKIFQASEKEPVEAAQRSPCEY